MVAAKAKAVDADIQKRKDPPLQAVEQTKISRLGEGRDSNGRTPIEAFTYDISIGGARIHAPEAFDVGPCCASTSPLSERGGPPGRGRRPLAQAG